MIVGIDIDGVLTNLNNYFDAVIMTVEVIKGSKLSDAERRMFKDSSNYIKYATEVYNIPKDMLYSKLCDALWLLYDRSIVSEDVKTALDRLYKLGVTVYIITARSENDCSALNALNYGKISYEDYTRNYLKYNKIHFNDLIFASYDKTEPVNNLHIDYMIDDYAYNIQEIANKCPNCTACLLSQDYNEDSIITGNYKIVNSLNEFVDLIEGDLNGKSKTCISALS